MGLTHGTKVKVAGKEFRVVALPPFWQTKVDVDIPIAERHAIEEAVGISFQSNGLGCPTFSERFANTATRGMPSSKGWSLKEINDEKVLTQDDVRNTLTKHASVYKLSFQ